MMQISMQYTYIVVCFFLIQITDYKNINEIFSYALKQRWKYMTIVVFSTPVQQ